MRITSGAVVEFDLTVRLSGVATTDAYGPKTGFGTPATFARMANVADIAGLTARQREWRIELRRSYRSAAVDNEALGL